MRRLFGTPSSGVLPLLLFFALAGSLPAAALPTSLSAFVLPFQRWKNAIVGGDNVAKTEGHILVDVEDQPMDTFPWDVVEVDAETLTRKADPTEAESPNDELVFVQAIWRHGDRSPTKTYKKDTNQEDSWPQGFGQLTPIGMEQHFMLGKKLRKKYVDTHKFLSAKYDLREIYVRSTDFNRTVISAVSNFIGFYHDAARAGVDYPTIPDWPAQYIPVPIHADPGLALLGNADSHCDRRVELYKLLLETDEFKQLLADNKDILDKIPEWTGEPISIEDVEMIADSLMIERIHKKQQPEWATDEVIERFEKMARNFEGLSYGVGVKPLDGVDFAHEFGRIRGGAMLKELINFAKHKTDCRILNNSSDNSNAMVKMNKKSRCHCLWMERTKYLVYSAHDVTIAGVAAALGAAEVEGLGYKTGPPYSTAVTLELWQRADSNNQTSLADFYVKFLLWQPSKADPKDVTHYITGCGGESTCSLERFIQRSIHVVPRPPMKDYCAVTDLHVDPNDQNDAMNALAHVSTKMTAFGTVLTMLLQQTIFGKLTSLL